MSNCNRVPASLIMFATLTTAMGVGISMLVLPWLVLQRHHSAGDASIVASAAMVPLVFSTLIAGNAIDYFGRRRVSLFCDFFTGVSVAAVPLIASVFGANALNVGVLALVAAFTATFDSAGMTARASMLPEAASRAGWSLDRMNSSCQGVRNVSLIVGPGIGGLMIAAIGGINTMWIVTGASGLSIMAIAALRLEGTGKPRHENRPEGLLSGIAEGLRFVWGLRVLRTLALIELAVAALYLPMESVLFPKYFVDRHQPAELGWVLAAMAVGSLAGALGYAALSKRIRRRTTVLVRILTLAAATVGFALLPPLPIILVLSVFVGLVYGPIRPIYLYLMHTRAPHHLRGRAVGAMTSLTCAAAPLGLVLAGPLSDAVGLRATFSVMAVPITVIGLVAMLLPSLHEMDRTSEQDRSERSLWQLAS
ncbi:MFS transporter [Mycobacterium riyadhense]|nr:MFS transporter [Mycobacterium riyadhense]MCV7147910.1 MFS transporter [Mycobacterium riyadhense]ORW56992.1 MFS transporter [Mycobacterium riyadhense]